MSQIIFISTFIGPKSLLDVSNKFEKIENARYLFFTNLEKSDILNEDWEIITIDSDFMSQLRADTKEDCVKMSRYFKFNVYPYLLTYLKINLKDTFIFYCDSYLFPSFKKSWMEICNQFKNHSLPIIQYEHGRKKGGITTDLTCIHRGKKDTQKNMKALEEYLKKLNPNVSLSTPQYYENTVIGFYVNKQVVELGEKFWNLYVDSPSYRDQPLWNFIYLNENCRPFVDNNFRGYFKGTKHIDRHLKEYEKAKL